jgi:hypothetical protein
MRTTHAFLTLLIAGLTWVALSAPRTTLADVTVQQQTVFDFSLMKMHGNSTEYTTTDKQRRDSDFRCEGFMSWICGNPQSAEIVRLDRNVQWTLEPKKKQYRETAFMTEAERQAAQQQAQQMMEKMKQCPAMQQGGSSAPDTSKCEMSPPKVSVKQPGTHALFAGHDTQLTQVALSRSCTNRQTGDVCEFVFALDSWLTQDQIAGLDDRKAFEKAYLAKMGMDPNDPAVQKQVSQFLAPYADSLKELSSHASELKGYPLKSVVRIGFGGEHCGAAKNAPAGSAGSGSVVGDASQAASAAATSSAAGAAGAAAGTAASNAAGNSVGGSVLGSAASAFGSKLVGGLFSKKKAEPAAAPATSAAAPDNGLGAGMVQAASITIETTAINPGPVASTEFELPADYKLAPPQAAKASKEFTCPSAGAGT